MTDSERSAEIGAFIEDTYQQIRKVRRELRPDDKIADDLGIDSLHAIDMIAALEARFQIALFSDPRTGSVRTVGELTELVASLLDTRAQGKLA